MQVEVMVRHAKICFETIFNVTFYCPDGVQLKKEKAKHESLRYASNQLP